MAIRATVGEQVAAESDRTVTIEGNEYFPPDAVAKGALRESEKLTHCHWKGKARTTTSSRAPE